MESQNAFIGGMFFAFIITGVISLVAINKKIGFFSCWLISFSASLLIGLLFGSNSAMLIGFIVSLIIVSTSPAKGKKADSTIIIQEAEKHSLADELTKLNNLKEKGVISEDEFQIQKDKLLNGKK